MIQITEPVIGPEEYEALREPLESGWLTQGPKVAAFEQRFAEVQGVQHAIACSSCTTALHLILAALDVGPGDEIIVPSFTWVATANAVLYCGATPVLADVEPSTFNLDPEDVRRRLTPRTRAVIAVHMFGRCADVDALAEILPDGVDLLEDAACAAGATWQGRPAGTLGRAAAFSFHPRKAVTTGEGGMVTTADDALAERVARLRSHGASISEEQRHQGAQPYLLPAFDEVGFNYRMTDLQGAIGTVQIQRLEQLVTERDRIAARYAQALATLPWLATPTVPPQSRHSWQSYVCTVDPDSAPVPRNTIMKHLHEHGIATRPGTHAVHTLGAYQELLGFAEQDLPGALWCAENSMAIPLHNRLDDTDIERVIVALYEIGQCAE